MRFVRTYADVCANLVVGYLFFFFFNDTATTEIYTLSLHDALPISMATIEEIAEQLDKLSLLDAAKLSKLLQEKWGVSRSEEHTSELQSPCNLVCRLLLEKKKEIYRRSYLAPHNSYYR